jgi:hypothetical protein
MDHLTFAEQSQKEILKEISKLKLQHPLSDKDKLRLQKLQQKLNS